jgi:hypothetical protein
MIAAVIAATQGALPLSLAPRLIPHGRHNGGRFFFLVYGGAL